MAGSPEQRSVAREGQTFAGRSLAVRYVNLVKLPHTVFALPFALLGTVYASFYHPVTLGDTVVVIAAFTAARFAAMAFNRIVDRHLDALNPRTEKRELPTEQVTVLQAWIAVVVASLAFIWAAALLNPVCLALSPIALVWILSYSYTKRFTSLSHLWLGGALAIAPAGGYLAIAGTWSTPWWTLVLLSAAVALWVAGFDIFYALQDEGFDRGQGLRSIPVRFGVERSIMTAKLFHYIMIAAMVGFAATTPFGWIFAASVLVGALILLWEHKLVRPGDLTRLDAAFFSFNGVMSIVIFLGALGDRLV